MPYNTTTQASFTAELAQALNDPNHTYWALDELNRALNEALLLWGALTCYWTTKGIFNTAANTPFYDLSVQIPTLRSRAYTLGNLTTEMQYHLLEATNGTNGAGMTSQFTIGQLTSALIRRRNQFVIDSRIPLSFATFPSPAPPVDAIQLDPSVALIARAAWVDGNTGIVTPLRRSDSFAAQSYSPLWNLNPGKPYGYSQLEAMPGTMLLIPPALASGSVHLTYAKTLTLAVADATSLAIPDEFAFALKYGALYEVLSTTSQGYDPLRAKYCEERYSAAMEVARAQRSIIRVRSNDVSLPLSTITDLDNGQSFWQTLTGAPALAACAYDLVAFSKVPNAAYSITCDVSRTAPLPVLPGDFIQMGPEEMPYLFDYCRHILLLKIGGTEFIQSMPLHDNFMKGASQRSQLITYKARYLSPLFDTPAKQESETNAA